MDNAFREWLTDHKLLTPRSAGNVGSHLNRVFSIMDIKQTANVNKLLFELSEKEEFQKMSVSVRSHLRRAVLLYCEFKTRK